MTSPSNVDAQLRAIHDLASWTLNKITDEETTKEEVPVLARRNLQEIKQLTGLES